MYIKKNSQNSLGSKKNLDVLLFADLNPIYSTSKKRAVLICNLPISGEYYSIYAGFLEKCPGYYMQRYTVGVLHITILRTNILLRHDITHYIALSCKTKQK